jgi:hypothetical protein
MFSQEDYLIYFLSNLALYFIIIAIIMKYNIDTLLQFYGGTYGVAAFTAFELKIISTIIEKYSYYYTFWLAHNKYFSRYILLSIIIIFKMFLAITLYRLKKNFNKIKFYNYIQGNYYKINKNGLALQYVKYQTDDICEIAVKQNGLAIQYVQNQTPKFCMFAYIQNKNSKKYFNSQNSAIGEKNNAFQFNFRNDDYLKCVYKCHKNNGKYDNNFCVICMENYNSYFCANCDKKHLYCFDCFEKWYGLQISDNDKIYYNHRKCVTCTIAFDIDDIYIVEF